MAKRTKKLSKSSLKLEALEQRQLLAGVVGGGTEVTPGGAGADHFITHPNGNHYDQVLMTGEAVSVTNDAGTVTRVSFLDAEGDIVQAEFSGAGKLTVSLANATADVAPEKYLQTGVKYMQGTATFTIEGSDATTNFSVFSVGSKTAQTPGLFDGEHMGGNHTADVARITVVADPAAPNGSIMGGIRAGNAVFSAESGPVGISAANVQVQNAVIIGDINAKGTATPTLVFGTKSQFGDVYVAGGGLVSANGRPINNSDSYNFALTLAAGEKSDGTADAAETTQAQLSFTGNNPVEAQTRVFDLTGGVDTITGTTGSDTVRGTEVELTALDTINGNAGTDSLIINDTTGSADFSLATISNIENLALNSVSTLNGNALDVSGWSGLTAATISINTAAASTVTAAKTTDVSLINRGVGNLAVIGGGDSLVVQNGAGTVTVGGTAVANDYTSASIKGGTTVDITDRSGASAAVGTKLASVTLDGNTGLATLTSDGLTSVTLKNLAAATTITSTKDHALTLEVNKVTGGTVTDAKATSVSVNSTGDSSGITLTAVAAKTVTLNGGTGKLTLADVNLTAAETIAITGAKDVTVTATTDVAALKTIDASAATGKVTITPALAVGVTYTGGTGADSISLAATTKAITTGAGDDTVTVGVGALGTGGSINGGDGADTLKISAANAVTASGDNKFSDAVSGFERLTLTGITNETIDLSKIDGISYVEATGANLATLNKMAANGTLVLNGTSTAVTVNLTDASGSSDVLNVNLGGTSNVATAYGSITAADVETVNVTTDSTNDTPDGTAVTATLVATSAKTVTVSGDAGAGLTFAGTKLTSLDASGITKGGLTWTAGALEAAATIKGSAGVDTITATAATKAVTIEAGDGANVIVVANGQANSVTSGKDVDTITLGNGGNTVVSGAGADVIVTGTGADTIDAGAGDDSITSGTGLDQLTGGAGNDTFNLVAPVNGNSYATILDLTAGDKLSFVDQGTETFATAKITLAGTAAFQDYIDAAAAANNAAANGNFAWFQYGGDTYVVQDNSDALTFQNGADIVVKIAGTSLDLSKMTGGATNVLTIV